MPGHIYYFTLAAYPLDTPPYIHVGGSGFKSDEAPSITLHSCVASGPLWPFGMMVEEG